MKKFKSHRELDYEIQPKNPNFSLLDSDYIVRSENIVEQAKLDFFIENSDKITESDLQKIVSAPPPPKEGKSAEEIKPFDYFYNERGDYTVYHQIGGGVETFVSVTNTENKAKSTCKLLNKLFAQQFQSTPISSELKEYMGRHLTSEVLYSDSQSRLPDLKNKHRVHYQKNKEKFERFLTELSTLKSL